jgi:hypothetical protein
MKWKKDWKVMSFSSSAKEFVCSCSFTSSPMINMEIAKRDRRWWLEDKTPAEARQEIISACGQHVSVDTFVTLVWNICRYYGKNPRLSHLMPETKSPDEYWDRLKMVVERNFSDLEGLDVKSGIKLIRLYCPVGESQLEGLPRRLHFWRKPADRINRVRGQRVRL